MRLQENMHSTAAIRITRTIHAVAMGDKPATYTHAGRKTHVRMCRHPFLLPTAAAKSVSNHSSRHAILNSATDQKQNKKMTDNESPAEHKGVSLVASLIL
mmetsp:Transcript_20452/g.49738  ORF Transcript_20452/g.49738 Transcript_20452/m.49738 type:complete len:100 (-) Transcript_20452:789-1088(-)